MTRCIHCDDSPAEGSDFCIQCGQDEAEESVCRPREGREVVEPLPNLAAEGQAISAILTTLSCLPPYSAARVLNVVDLLTSNPSPRSIRLANLERTLGIGPDDDVP